MLKNMIRIGHISSVDETNGTVRVIIDDQQDIVTDDLPLFSSEYDMPDIGDLVACLFLGNGISSGICIGKYYNNDNPPPVANKNIWAKDFGDGTSIQYNKTTQEFVIIAIKDLKITVGGDLTIAVAGDINTIALDGSITTSAGETNTDISNTKTIAVTHH